jgi:pimeloyl-ACP methyl ester carboxylesterase
MHWRKVLLGGGAALGAAATFNALTRRRVQPLANPLGGDEGWFEWRGHHVAFTRRGTGPAVLLVHGIHAAAWSFEWRSNVEALAASHTVYALDLLGFGRSSRPSARYTSQLYLALIGDFAARVVRAPCTLIASSLSAAYAIALAARDPGRFPAVVAVCPTGVARLQRRSTTGGDVARAVVDAPLVGTAMFNGLVSRRGLRSFLERTYADNSLVTDALVDVYYQAAHQPGARHAPAAFIASHLNIDVRSALRRLAQPMLLVWGQQAVEAPVDDVLRFRALKPDLRLAILDPAGGLPHDEQPDEFNEIVIAFLERTGVAAANA